MARPPAAGIPLNDYEIASTGAGCVSGSLTTSMSIWKAREPCAPFRGATAASETTKFLVDVAITSEAKGKTMNHTGSELLHTMLLATSTLVACAMLTSMPALAGGPTGGKVAVGSATITMPALRKPSSIRRARRLSSIGTASPSRQVRR